MTCILPFEESRDKIKWEKNKSYLFLFFGGPNNCLYIYIPLLLFYRQTGKMAALWPSVSVVAPRSTSRIVFIQLEQKRVVPLAPHLGYGAMGASPSFPLFLSLSVAIFRIFVFRLDSFSKKESPKANRNDSVPRSRSLIVHLKCGKRNNEYSTQSSNRDHRLLLNGGTATAE